MHALHTRHLESYHRGDCTCYCEDDLNNTYLPPQSSPIWSQTTIPYGVPVCSLVPGTEPDMQLVPAHLAHTTVCKAWTLTANTKAVQSWLHHDGPGPLLCPPTSYQEAALSFSLRTWPCVLPQGPSTFVTPQSQSLLPPKKYPRQEGPTPIHTHT